MRQSGLTRRSAGLAVSAILFGGSGCFNAWLNGLLNPTEVGQFLQEKTGSIRPSISELEEPELLAGATDPQPEDLKVIREVPRIKPDDFLVIRVFELLAPGTETVVQPQVDMEGSIYVPVMGWLHVEGLTARELQTKIAEIAQERGILQEAEVSVTLVPGRQKTYDVFGSVFRPGTFGLIRNDFRLMEALNLAGGLVDQADWVYIYRRQKEGLEAEAAEPAPPEATTESAPFGRGSAASTTLWIDAPRAMQATWVAEQPVDTEADEPPAQPPTTREAELLEATRPKGTDRPGDQALEPASAPAPGLSQWIYDPTRGWIEVPAGEEQPTTEGAATAPREAEVFRPPQPGVPTQPETDRSLFEPLVGAEEEAPPEVRIIAVPAGPLRDGDPRYDLIVREGDTVRVMAGEMGEYFMMGHVARPGAYSLGGRRLTLKQALAAAGGMDALGWPDKCEIIRRIGSDREQIVQVNLDRIFAGLDSDLVIKKDDIINVGTHPVAIFLAVIRSAFRFTYGFGFVYDRNFGDIDAFTPQINPGTLNIGLRQQRFPGLFP